MRHEGGMQVGCCCEDVRAWTYSSAAHFKSNQDIRVNNM
jgi:hypothetical protein